MKRRDWMKQGLLLPALGLETQAQTARSPQGDNEWSNSRVQVEVHGSDTVLWTLRSGSQQIAVGPPSFLLNGTMRTAALHSLARVGSPQELGNNILERRFSGKFTADPSLDLELVFRLAQDCPVVRFRYILHAPDTAKLTGHGAQLRYLTLSLADRQHCVEVQLSAFNEMFHSYTVAELPVAPRAFEDGTALIGPILVASNDANKTLLAAYEHGAQIPDSFLRFKLDAQRNATLEAVKANYVPGQQADKYATVWMQLAANDAGPDELAADYRRFVLHGLTTSGDTRRPYIFYNTWNFQERNKWFNGKPYLQSMTPERMLSEIDVAHRMGIDVFVMDTGWYAKTGDWQVSRTRFTNGLTDIHSRLSGYGMKLGLWFDPTAAGKSSRMLSENRQCVRTKDGKEGEPHPIWETEESYPMCLVSPYSDAFADVLIRVAKETGVRYFKWDAIGQYGCDSPHHWHGGPENTQDERWNSYAFQLPQQMARVAEKVATAIPGAIVDFDITEAGRAVGLSFLSAGKYFLINNGPYKFNYDLPLDREHQNWNLFFYPGPARTWICRSPLTYDKWIPSILFLTHYLPDDPKSSQLVNVGSLILGQNGIWGDLPAVSSEGVSLIGSILARYKTVRDDITASAAIVTGAVGASPEIHEKISPQTGKGAVVLFAAAPGKYSYVMQSRPDRSAWCAGGVTARYDAKGRAVIEADFAAPGTGIVLFGSTDTRLKT